MVNHKGSNWSAWSLSVLLLFSCADTNRFDLLVDQARLRWEKAICRTPRYRTLEIVRSIPSCQNSTKAWGCYDYVSGELLVSRTTPKDQRLKVLTHEMGHSISPGHGHLETRTGIMYLYADTVPDVITSDDIDFICKEYDCPCRNPEKLP